MRRFWLLFAQATTIAVAALFVVSTFRPEWMPARPARLALVSEASPVGGAIPTASSYAEAVRRATPSVVNIFTSKEVRTRRHSFLNDPAFRRNFGDAPLPEEARRASSLGSGVIFSSSGYVLTNHHVVEAADEIEVALADGRKFLAKVVGADPETDLAVLRLDAENLPAITFGSYDALRVGRAEKGGWRPGAVVVEVNGRPVSDPPSMLNAVAALTPGSSARLGLRRQGKPVDAAVVIGRRPKPPTRPE